MEKVVIFSGSFNPPGIHHQRIIETVANLEMFSEIIIVPCGERADKNFPPSFHRINMVEMAFSSLPKCSLDLSNLEHNLFTSNYKLEDKYRHKGDIWHLVGTDLVMNGKNGKSSIQARWERGMYIWGSFNFLIVSRKDFLFSSGDLPPRHILLELNLEGSSSLIKKNIMNCEPVAHLLNSNVFNYIKENNIY